MNNLSLAAESRSWWLPSVVAGGVGAVALGAILILPTSGQPARWRTDRTPPRSRSPPITASVTPASHSGARGPTASTSSPNRSAGNDVDPSTGTRALHQVWQPPRASVPPCSGSTTPTTELLVSGAADGRVSLWDATTLDLMGTVYPPHHGKSVPAGAQFIGDTHDVAIASYDGKVYRWETDLDRAIDFACQMAGRNLTQAEWEQFLPGQPYREVCPGL